MEARFESEGKARSGGAQPVEVISDSNSNQVRPNESGFVELSLPAQAPDELEGLETVIGGSSAEIGKQCDKFQTLATEYRDVIKALEHDSRPIQLARYNFLASPVTIPAVAGAFLMCVFLESRSLRFAAVGAILTVVGVATMQLISRFRLRTERDNPWAVLERFYEMQSKTGLSETSRNEQKKILLKDLRASEKAFSARLTVAQRLLSDVAESEVSNEFSSIRDTIRGGRNDLDNLSLTRQLLSNSKLRTEVPAMLAFISENHEFLTKGLQLSKDFTPDSSHPFALEVDIIQSLPTEPERIEKLVALQTFLKAIDELA